MPQVNQSLLNEMIKNISDPKLRETYGQIISGGFPFNVYCMEPGSIKKKLIHKPGILIGHIDQKGSAIDNPAFDKPGEGPVAGIETSRDRFDGRKGFRCYCGNQSIRAVEEQVVMGSVEKNPVFARPMNQNEMGKVFSALQEKGKVPGYNFVNGICEYDGFKVEEVKP